MDIFNNPELKVNAIRIKLKLIRIGIHNLNLAVALGCEVMSSPHFYSDVMPDIEGQQLFAEISINGAKGAAYSSSIVYAHAMCETILMDVCQLIRMKEPEAWDFYLVNKKVSFSDIVNRSTDEIRANLIKEFLENLQKESLLKKVDVLMGILKPETIQDIIPGFRYSPETLKAIDELRHKSVHQANWFEPFDTFENVEKMTDYLRNVAETIFLLSLRRYKIIEEA